ncbi:hypothetical protein [Subtercola boreus]|nr:hypothetical protein [Subtercola boreus]RFA20601.1 hypothetical protein B7R24_09225 [Subtercola boreus]
MSDARGPAEGLTDGPAAGRLAPAARSPRRRRLLIALGALAVVVVMGAGFWFWSSLSETRYEAAGSALQSQLADESAAVHAYNARRADVNTLAVRVRSIVDRAEFSADTSAPADAVRRDLAVLEPLASSPNAPEPAALPQRADAGGYEPPWQLTSEAETLEDAARQSQQATERLVASTGATKSAGEAASASEAAYFETTAQSAEQVIAANALSDRSVQVALLDLVEEARNPAMSASRNGAFLGSVFEAESQVRSSQGTNQAEQDDPAWAVRREIEAYARSLSRGVALEFVWAPEVDGLGEGWLSGTAEPYEDHGGYAIISLNYSMEDAWNDGLNDTDARALVAHEVGHTQIFRCATLFADPAIGQNQEMWATAWSISLGYDVDGSGIQAYGRPTDAQIAVAAQCR